MRILVRACVLLALAVPVSVSVVPASEGFAEDDPLTPPTEPGYQFYEKTAARILRTAGMKVFEAGDTARKWGLHQFAYEQSQRALEFDPDLKEAREHLGYVRKAEKWVVDESAASKVLKQNQRSQNQSQESFDKLIQKWQDEHLKTADGFVAAKYAELGDECAAKGHPLQAIKGWESALRLDKENARARKGLGYKKFGKVWLTEKQDKARKEAAKGTELKEESQWDSFFGTKLNKVESGHFRMESPYAVAELMEYVAAAETAYAYYLADCRRSDGKGPRGHLKRDPRRRRRRGPPRRVARRLDRAVSRSHPGGPRGDQDERVGGDEAPARGEGRSEEGARAEVRARREDGAAGGGAGGAAVRAKGGGSSSSARRREGTDRGVDRRGPADHVEAHLGAAG